MIHHRLPIAGGMLAVFLSACGGGGEQTPAAATAEENAKVLVKVEKVIEQPVEQLIELTGNVQAFKSNDIATTIPGRIDNILVEVGDRVQKGQTLVQMDRTNLLQAKIQLQNAERELARVDTLYRLGSATQQQFDQLNTQVDVAREALRNLEENTTLLSPIDGVVTARNFDPKNIYPGSPPILNVMQISPVKVIINISESYFPRVKNGMEVKVRLEVYPDKVFIGRISLIYPVINQSTRTFEVEVSIPNGDMTLRPGMFSRVELNFGTVDNVVVPDRAIIKQMGTNNKFIFVVENGVAYQKKVETGRRVGTTYELLSGVDNGATVVVEGQSKLLDGTEVKIIEN
ncbi:MAG: efflux RND transporter periplasmic adaptor subunit [Bacteroidales bacterium]|jgi:RND family efflux transporter MFP subunit|nr:efflux RND transporter periplasmic adaptor subunit [Bacteroidales bacterium]